MEARFVNQGGERRSLETSMDIGFALLSDLPDESLVRLSDAQLDDHIRTRRRGG